MFCMSEILKQRVLLQISFAILNIFSGIFIFKNLGGIYNFLVAETLMFTGIAISFGLFGLLFARFQINLKYTFSFGIFLTGASLLLLFGYLSVAKLFLFSFIWGLGQGLIWNGININELISVADDHRTKYVAKFGFISKLVGVVIPMFLTVLFWIFSDFAYYILFSISMLCLFVAAYFAYKTFDYIPPKIVTEDWIAFWLNKKVLDIKLYMFVSGSLHIVESVLVPVTAIVILQTELNVGFYQSVAAVFSLGLMYIGSKNRRDNDNKKLLVLFTLFLLPFLVLFAYTPSIYTFLILSVVSLICLPQLSVSEHYIDLTTMKVGSKDDQSIYANSLFREVVLYFGRLVVGLSLLFVISQYNSNLEMLQVGYLFLAFLFVVKAYVGYRVISKIQA